MSTPPARYTKFNKSQAPATMIRSGTVSAARHTRRKRARWYAKNFYTAMGAEQYTQENLYAKLTPEQKSSMDIWSMDCTEQKINGKKNFTCGIISVKRKILVGYAQGNRCKTELAMKAMANAMLAYGIPDTVMTDRGSQFVSRDFHAMREDWGDQAQHVTSL